MIKVSDNLFRGPRLKAQEEFVALKNSGITQILNLQSTWNNQEFEWAMELGIAPLQLNLCPVVSPNEHLVMCALRTILKQDRITYLHCRAGVDRTGFVVAAYRMLVEKKSYEEALIEFRLMGRHLWFFWWDSKLKQYKQ